jgi:hypothetical protein
MPAQNLSLQTLWDSVQPSQHIFQPDALSAIPATAQRYLMHAIAPVTKLASAVHLKMHGEIKLKTWQPFTAEQVITANQGMIWQAKVRMNGLPIYGSDRLINGAGSMSWKLLGLLSMEKASGDDITRSAIGRVQAESIWLPSIFCSVGASWQEAAEGLKVNFTSYDRPTELTLVTRETGQLQTVTMQRWGNPTNQTFQLFPFGGIIDAENTFDGYTIPTQVRIGWYFGSARFEPEGEFFRAIVDHASFR